MHWNSYLLAVLDDLEMQADGLRLADRADEVESLSVAGYAEVDLAARWHSSLGNEVRLELADGADVRGVLRRTGLGWVLVDAGSTSAVVRTAAVLGVRGLAPDGVAPAARALTTRLSLASVLRALADARQECVVRTLGGLRFEGVVGRVGADFAELGTASGQVVLPFGGISTVQEPR